MSTKQFTTQNAPEGYWVDAKGILTPVDIIKEIDQERDNLVGEIVKLSVKVTDALDELKTHRQSEPLNGHGI
ncbi:DUF3164 family protein [Xenorhabdus sp. IM139775]|uniref:DUF3164 family protein n=1 Tax=Xenorhabdus sp. IM139775 TaxID=3025876 RepID=UPI0023592FB4|nr:DUF3164 family protein [Xenorhabdus sp. IM139775]MDC9594296.1 DUF3164 family protein [Xenorhabdus sp. IM139775]